MQFILPAGENQSKPLICAFWKQTLPSVKVKTLGKDSLFAECQGPALGKAATWRDPGAGTLPSARRGHSAKFQTLPSACRYALGKAPAQGGATWLLCRVSRHSAKPLQSARNPTLGKVNFAVRVFAECRLPSVTLGKDFAEWDLSFAECN